MLNAQLDKAQGGMKSARKVSITSHDTTFMAESEEELKSLLMKLKEENEKAG